MLSPDGMFLCSLVSHFTQWTLLSYITSLANTPGWKRAPSWKLEPGESRHPKSQITFHCSTACLETWQRARLSRITWISLSNSVSTRVDYHQVLELDSGFSLPNFLVKSSNWLPPMARISSGEAHHKANHLRFSNYGSNWYIEEARRKWPSPEFKIWTQTNSPICTKIAFKSINLVVKEARMRSTQ